MYMSYIEFIKKIHYLISYKEIDDAQDLFNEYEGGFDFEEEEDLKNDIGSFFRYRHLSKPMFTEKQILEMIENFLKHHYENKIQ